MATWEYELAQPPTEPRARELWLQHAAGFIIFEDARRYALRRLDPALGAAARAAAEKAIDDALYGMMMIGEGVTGALKNESDCVSLRLVARFSHRSAGDVETTEEMDLGEGDGLCMGFHGWRDGDFGSSAVAVRSQP